MKTPDYSFKKFNLVLIAVLFVLSSFEGFSQDGTSFYLEAYNKADLTPISKTQNGKFVELEFTDSQLNAIFNNLEILDFDDAFAGLPLCDDLDNVFTLELAQAVSIERFKSNSIIKTVEIIPEYELAIGDLPNDYYIPTFDNGNQYESPGDSIRNDYLDLIQAPCAWELTKGDPNVIVGVSDSYFSEVHEELNGKFEVILGTGVVLDNYKHGIETSSLIAGNSDNNKGTASIGYNTQLAGAIGLSNDKLKDLVEWSLINNKNLRIINMSWGHVVDGNHSDFNDENTTPTAKLLHCLRDQYNIVLIAAAGNKAHITKLDDNDVPIYAEGWKNEINRFRFYPASYESVISVTSVGGSRYE